MVHQSKLIALLARNLPFLLLLALRVEAQHVELVGLAEEVQDFLGDFVIEVHAGHSHDGVPEVVVVGLLEVAHHAVG